MRVGPALRSGVVAGLAVVLCVAVGAATRQPTVDSQTHPALVERYAFDEQVLNPDPADARTVRQVQPALQHIRAWISAVGASVGLADFTGNGRSDEYCLVDPRDDSVTIGSVPGHPEPFPPFPLTPRGVAYDQASTAPMGCVPADLNEDGHLDVLVFFWGRTPLAYLRDPATGLRPAAFAAVDVAPDPGEIWNSTTANVADLDGDGHLDIVVGNYFPDRARVLDPQADDDPYMRMHASMSDAGNGGRNRILRLARIRAGDGPPQPVFEDASAALTDRQARSWTLALGAQDLNGDGLPELYAANDFGPDNLLVNHSRPGRIELREVFGERSVDTPKSKVLGRGSFKGMGVTFADLNQDGRPDIFVSNITTPFGLHESNHAFLSTSAGPITGDRAPYRDDSEQLGLSRSGWAWDIRAADFDGDGTPELAQALGFVRGERNRWPELQELAMTNDSLLQYPQAWPRFEPGDDIAGHQRNALFAWDQRSGRFVDIAADLGLSDPGPTRALAVGDVDHDGKPDLLVANQWAPSTFLRNTGADRSHLGLRLMLPAEGAQSQPRPAIGAAVTVTTADGATQRQQLYPANGHTGTDAAELVFGLGASAGGPVTATIRWRDGAGLHTTTAVLDPGWHTLVLEPGQPPG